MVARLVIFLVGWALLFSVPVAAIGFVARKRLAFWWRHRTLKAHMQENALALAANSAMTCIYCLQPTTPADCYEPHRGAFHIKCLQDLLG
jgi:hypothetical protein